MPCCLALTGKYRDKTMRIDCIVLPYLKENLPCKTPRRNPWKHSLNLSITKCRVFPHLYSVNAVYILRRKLCSLCLRSKQNVWMDCYEICTDIFYSMNTADFRMMCDSKDSLELNFGPVCNVWCGKLKLVLRKQKDTLRP